MTTATPSTMPPATAASPAGESALDRWMFEAYRIDPRGLAVVRVLFALDVLLIELPRYTTLGGLPDSFFAPPPGLGSFFTGFPAAWFFYVLNALLAGAAVCLLTGWRTRLASFTIAGGFLIGNTFMFACGKVNHDIMLILLPALAGMAGWGRCWSMDARRARANKPDEPPAWPLALLALILGLSLFSAGYAKANTGWLDPATQSCQAYLVNRSYVTNSGLAPTRWLLSIHSPVLWEIVDWSTVLLEAAFLPAILRPRWFRTIAMAAVGLHVGIWFTMSIYFGCNMLAYATLAAWPLLLDRPGAQRCGAAWQRMIDRLPPGVVATLAALAAAIYATLGNPLELGLDGIDINGDWWPRTAACTLAIAIATAFLVSRACRQHHPERVVPTRTMTRQSSDAQEP